ncbi:potassium voltage-gated channel subfamily A member 7-like [Branchiostoma lanceolatum]|uniref:potassium voltage-gated channel subfamily A member 7-like n=1 Tax=Branchiostoma lanceolatum TaxID=7740 RepID=UPI0034565B03
MHIIVSRNHKPTNLADRPTWRRGVRTEAKDYANVGRKTENRKDRRCQELPGTFARMSAELQWPNPAQRVTFNVAGMTFEVTARVLDRYPKTLLGCPRRLREFWDPTRQEYFLDRHRPSAEAIVDFYQTGRLRRPEEVPIEVFTDEIRFYQLGDDVMRRFRASEGFQRKKIRVLPQKKYLAPVWLMFEYPDSSIWAAMLAFVSVSFILLSIASICTESFPQFRLETVDADQPDRSDLSRPLGTRFGNRSVNVNTIHNSTNSCVTDSTKTIAGANASCFQKLETVRKMRSSLTFHDPFFAIDTVCTAWFTVELLVRFLSCPDRARFCKGKMNVIDFVSVVPYFILLITEIPGVTATTGLEYFLKVLRLTRVLRVLKLSRYSNGLQTMGKTVLKSLSQIGSLLVFLSILMILFSSLIYYTGKIVPEPKFQSIPDGFWWSLITMLTVGYGDFAPKTLLGKLVGSLCAFAGMLAIALPVPIIVSNFELLYNIQPDDEDLYGSTEEVEPDVVSSTSDGGYQSGSVCTDQFESPKRVVQCSNHSDADDISVMRSEQDQPIGYLQLETVL